MSSPSASACLGSWNHIQDLLAGSVCILYSRQHTRSSPRPLPTIPVLPDSKNAAALAADAHLTGSPLAATATYDWQHADFAPGVTREHAVAIQGQLIDGGHAGGGIANIAKLPISVGHSFLDKAAASNSELDRKALERLAEKISSNMAPGTATTGWQHAAQGVTRNLPALIRDPAVALLGHECYTTLVYNVDLSSSQCVRLAISKALGLGIVVFGSIMKVPQILKITNSRSAAGISLSMYILEVLAYTISLAYAFRRQIPFSTYGENASLTLQNMAITLLIIAYTPTGKGSAQQGRSGALAIAAALMAGLALFLFTPALCSMSLLSFLQATTIPISLASKVPQMRELHVRKAPGQLSAVVVFAQLLGTVARVFTTLTETDDKLLFWGFALATVFNAVIAVQLVMYWNGNDRLAGTGGVLGEKRGRKLD